MTKLEKFFSKFQLVPVRSKKLTVIVVAVAFVLSIGALAALHYSMQDLRSRTLALQEKAIHLEAENAELLEDIEQVDSITGIVKIAEEELGLVQPDTVFYQPEP